MPDLSKDIDELIALGASDQEIADVMAEKIRTAPMQTEQAAVDAAAGALGPRLGRGLRVAAQTLSPVAPITQATEAAQKREMPSIGTMLGLAGPVLGAAGMAGTPGLMRAGLVGTGLETALGAGAGAALAGPELEQLGQKLGGETGAQIGAAIPAMLGGMAGPAALGAIGKGAKAAGLAAVSPIAGPGALAMAKRTAGEIPASLDLPIARAQKGVLSEGTGFLTPEQIQLAQEFEKRTGIKPTPGMAQYLTPGKGGGMAESAAKDIEFRTKQTDVAKEFQQGAGQKFRDYISGLVEKIQPGSSLPSGQIGEGIQASFAENLKNASTRYADSESALKASKLGNTPIPGGVGSGWSEDLGKLAAQFDFSDEGLKFLEEAQKKAAGAKNINDMVRVRRWMKEQTKNALNKHGEGTAGTFEEIQRQANQALDNRLGEFAREMKPEEGKFLSDYIDASRNYWQAKFSPEAKLARQVTGVKSPDELPVKSGEEVSSIVAKSPQNLAPRILSAEQAGVLGGGGARKTVLSMLTEAATNPQTGEVEFGRLSGVWNSLKPSQKVALFGKEEALAISQAIKDAETLTYAGRYKPPTGAALPTLLPGLAARFGGVPVVGTAAKMAAGASELAKPGEAAAYYGSQLRAAETPSRAAEASFIGGKTGGAAAEEARKRRLTFFQSLSR